MINIKKNCIGARCGYVFKLEDKSSYEGYVSVDNVITAVFVRGSYYVYLNSSSRAVASKTILEQYENLQKALDYLSLRGIQNSSVKVPFGHYFFWQLLDAGYALKLTERALSQLRGTSGDISKLQTQNYHEGFRFFRFAQIAHDLYDAYRNLWLSFESLITTHTPRKVNKGRQEPEESWYCRALTELAQTTKSQELRDLLQKKPSATLMSELYKDIRCSLFHSKFGESKLIPHDLKQYKRVKTSLTDLTIIVTAILIDHYNIQPKSSWINPDIFFEGYKDLYKGIRLVVSNLEDEEILAADRFHELKPIAASHQVAHKKIKRNNHVEHLFTTSITLDDIGSQQARRFSLVKDDKELMAFVLDEDINLENVSNLEYESILGFGFIEKPRTYDYYI